jgi:ferrous iron transport protein A
MVLESSFGDAPVMPSADLDIDVPPYGAPALLASLADGRRGFRGVIADVRASRTAGGLPALELERRLLEMGFVEGARVEILHEGFIGRDPICVQLDDMRIALRRRDARGVFVRPDSVQ